MKKKCAEYSNYGRIQIENRVCFFRFIPYKVKIEKGRKKFSSSVSESDTYNKVHISLPILNSILQHIQIYFFLSYVFIL